MILNKNELKFIYLYGNENGINRQFDFLEVSLKLKNFKIIRKNHTHLHNILNNNVRKNSIWIIGYDLSDDADKLVKKLRSEGIKSFGLLDAWKGLYRFWKSNGILKNMPDILFVFDKKVREYLKNKGINTKIKVIINPILSALKDSKYSKKLIKKKVVKKLNLNVLKKNLFLFSEPIFIRNDPSPFTFEEVTEISSNKDLLDYLEDKYYESYNLILRNHPLDKQIKHQNWIYANELSEIEIFDSSDLIIGVGSTLLILAKIYGLNTQNFYRHLKLNPTQINYEKEIWDHLTVNLFSKPYLHNFKNEDYLSYIQIEDYILN